MSAVLAITASVVLEDLRKLGNPKLVLVSGDQLYLHTPKGNELEFCSRE